MIALIASAVPGAHYATFKHPVIATIVIVAFLGGMLWLMKKGIASGKLKRK